jgi:hypothetical protein
MTFHHPPPSAAAASSASESASVLGVFHFWLVVSSENVQTTMEEPELGFQFG